MRAPELQQGQKQAYLARHMSLCVHVSLFTSSGDSISSAISLPVL